MSDKNTTRGSDAGARQGSSGMRSDGNDAGTMSDRGSTGERSTSFDRGTSSDRGVAMEQPTRASGRWSSTSAKRGESYPTYGSPFTLMRRMAEDMDRLFDDFGMGRSHLSRSGMTGASDAWSHQGLPSSMSTGQATWNPEVEVFHRGGKVVVRADLPGLRKDDVHVDVEGDVLTISGERSHEDESDRRDLYRSERSYGSFWRAIALPDGVDAEDCEASFKDGVLEVEFEAPKEEQLKKKSIKVK